MSAIVTLIEKELKSYFASPIAYVATAMFLLVSGFFFSLILFISREASMRGLFYNMSITLLLITPVLTMRLFAEENKSKTLEILMTSPVRDYEVVLGKFLASLIFFLVMVGCTLSYLLVLKWIGDPDFGAIWGGYVGILLMGMSFLSLGMLASSLTSNQIVAAVSSFSILLILWFIGHAGSYVGNPSVGSVLSYLSISEHYDNFAKGVIPLKDVVYYLTFTFFALFVTTRALESRRWKG